MVPRRSARGKRPLDVASTESNNSNELISHDENAVAVESLKSRRSRNKTSGTIHTAAVASHDIQTNRSGNIQPEDQPTPIPDDAENCSNRETGVQFEECNLESKLDTTARTNDDDPIQTATSSTETTTSSTETTTSSTETTTVTAATTTTETTMVTAATTTETTDASLTPTTTTELEAWPGPWTTARNLAKLRPAAQALREEKIKELRESKEEQPKWIPKYNAAASVSQNPTKKTLNSRSIPSLLNMTLDFITKNIECVASLGNISQEARKSLASSLCKVRKLTENVLPLLIEDRCSDIFLPDCSLLDEDILVSMILERCSESTLESLILRYCGRCVSTAVLSHIGPLLSNLQHITLGGCYRISDKGFQDLVRYCPKLVHLSISSSSRLTSISIKAFSSQLHYLTSLRIEDCPQLRDSDLMCLKNLSGSLKKLSLSGTMLITDELVLNAIQKLENLQELSVARCTLLTSSALAGVLSQCSQLEEIDFSELPLLNDSVFETLIHPSLLHKVVLKRCLDLTDCTIDFIATRCAKNLQELDISSNNHITDESLASLRKHCFSTLQVLDVSFCRNISDDGLGLLTDECKELKSLVLWGCTQISSRFLLGHSLSQLIITGHPLLTGLTIKY